MNAIEIISQDVFDKIRSRFQNLEMGDDDGSVTIDPAAARFFDFDFVQEGVNLGRVSISLGDLGSLKIYYSQGITENQDDLAKKSWYNFLKEMRLFAMRRLLRFDTRDIAKSNLDKNDFQQMAATQGPKEKPSMNEIKKRVSENNGRELTNTPRDQMISRMSPSVDNDALMQKVGKVVNSPEFNSDTILKIVDSPNITHPVGRYIQKEFDELQYDLGRAYEDHPEEVAEKLLSMLKDRTHQGLQEGRWNNKSTKKTSRAVRGSTEVIVRHHESMDEMYPGARSHPKKIKAIFIQNKDGERFKYPFIHPAGAFAMAQHVDHGGIPHDPAGKAIIRMSEQIAQLQEFNRQVRSPSLHADASGITERAMAKLHHLKNHINALGKRGHYESWMAEFSGEGIDDPMMELDDVTMEQYKQAFTQTNFKEEIAKFFPLIHSIMSEADTVDLEDYVGENKDEYCDACDRPVAKCVCDDEVKESAFAAFENWAEAVEQGKLSPEQIKELKAAIEALPEGGLQLDTAYNFFNEYGINSEELENAFQQEAGRSEELRAEPIEVFKAWSKENYPELAVALGISDTEAPAEEPAPAEPAPVEPAPEAPVAESPEDRTSYQVAKILADKGITYDSSNEGELVKAIGMVLVKKLNMSPKQARHLISYDEDFLSDTMSELQHMEQNSADENTDMDPPPGTMEEDKGSMVQEVAKIVKSFYNRDNPNVGPFRGEEGIAIDVEKTISEKFGDKAGQQARELAEKFMEKLTMEWQNRHGQTHAVEPTDGLARLKELVGNIKTKVEGIGDRGNSGQDFNKNMMRDPSMESIMKKLESLAK
jgi:hypothetical protein